jgi:DNA-binding response OmpR family regulator
MPSRRILYVGHNLALFIYLQRILGDCRIVRAPGDSTVRALIAGINYSLLLFDEELPDVSGLELAEFSCSLTREVFTPFIIFKKTDSFESVANAIMQIFAQPLAIQTETPSERGG